MHPTLALLATAALLCPSGLAADPLLNPKPGTDAGARWSGSYAGLQAGAAFGRDRSLTDIPAAPALLFPGLSIFETAHPAGATGGALAGFGSATRHVGGTGLVGVVGVEADLDGSGYRRITTFGPGNVFSLGVGSRETIRSGVGGTLRARVGVASRDVLVYATGGAAAAEFLTSYYNVGTGFDGFSNARVGYTLGAGVEYALDDVWSLRTEYRHADFGTFTDRVAKASPLPGSSVSHRETRESVRVALSYRFAPTTTTGARH